MIIGTRGYPSYYGGFETAVRNLAPFLTDKGWDVTVYSRAGAVRPQDPAADPRVRSVTTRGIDSKSLSTLSYGFTATQHAIRHRPDVALVMNVANGFWLPLLRLARIPTLVNVDGIEWDRDKWGRLAKLMFHTGAKLTAKHGTSVVYDAEEIARRWLQEFQVAGTYIPYGGESPDEVLPIEPGLSHRGYALIVARFVPENTVPQFFDAVPRIAESLPVVIVGSSGYAGDLDARAQELSDRLENVRWVGHVSDDRRLFSLWQHAAAYFHGHSVGGTNPALVQAMACGAPVVARDTVYNREVLLDAAVFTDPNPSAIAETVLALAHDRRRADRLGAEARARASSAFTWHSVNLRYERALRTLVNASSTERRRSS